MDIVVACVRAVSEEPASERASECCSACPVHCNLHLPAQRPVNIARGSLFAAAAAAPRAPRAYGASPAGLGPPQARTGADAVRSVECAANPARRAGTFLNRFIRSRVRLDRRPQLRVQVPARASEVRSNSFTCLSHGHRSPGICQSIVRVTCDGKKQLVLHTHPRDRAFASARRAPPHPLPARDRKGAWGGPGLQRLGPPSRGVEAHPSR